MIPVFAPKFGLAGVIAGLFANGEQGAWYDPSDMSTMFQDAAGTTPVTAVEQPVGRILDKSGRGNHATQTTATSRPVLSARVNLLTATETLATQTVTTRATTQTLRFEGAGTVTLSGTATGTYSAGSHSVTTTAGNLTLTVSGTVTKADLRATNMGVGLPAYQRVNTATDYDADPSKFKPYLRFDGVDDWLVTPTITPGTDKAQVFAGVRKLSDASFPVICETYSTTIFANWTLHASESTSNTGYVAGVPTTLSAAYAGRSANNSAPVTNVISVNFASNVATLNNAVSVRVNSVAQSLTNINVGTPTAVATLGANPIYIGRRGGTTLPFNGHLYGLIVRFGANLPAGTIASTETWLNQRTGAY